MVDAGLQSSVVFSEKKNSLGHWTTSGLAKPIQIILKFIFQAFLFSQSTGDNTFWVFCQRV